MNRKVARNILDDFNIVFTFLVLVTVFVAFIMERIKPYLIALTGMGALLLSGAITTNDVLNVFSNSAPITIACLFIISAALDHTGVIDAIGRFLLHLSGESDMKGFVALIAIVVIASAFMNNIPVVIILTPVVITFAQNLKHCPSKYLIPLSYAAIMGGTCTLIGTSTNILVDAVAQEHNQPAFTMFEITAPGLIMAAFGMVYMGFIGRFLLPERFPPRDENDDGVQHCYFVAEATILSGSNIVGRTLNEIQFTEHGEHEIIDLIRKKRGSNLHADGNFPSFTSTLQNTGKVNLMSSRSISPLRDISLEVGDILVFKASKDELIELEKNAAIKFNSNEPLLAERDLSVPINIVEGVIHPNSNMVEKQIKNLNLCRRYGCSILGIHRAYKNITGDISNTVLRENDTLILEGKEDALTELFKEEKILTSTQMRQRSLDTKLAPIPIVVILTIVILSAFGVMPIAGLAFLGAIVVVFTGCVSPEHAYDNIDWQILLLIFGMLGIGTAMENTGAVLLLVNTMVGFVEALGPLAILAIVYLITSILTEIVTNSAVAIVMTPVVIGLSATLGYDARPFIVAVMFAASASFSTPIGYQTNTFVYVAGGYKFTDFIKIGLPMDLIMMAVAVLVIPLFWSF